MRRFLIVVIGLLVVGLIVGFFAVTWHGHAQRSVSQTDTSVGTIPVEGMACLACTARVKSTPLGMALMSLGGALVAFRGIRLKVDQLEALRRPGLAGAFLYGFVFSLGTSVAPLLLLLTFAASQRSPENGFVLVLALAFGLGRGLPFLLVGLFAGAVMRLARLGSWRRSIELVSGCALLFVSVYYARVFAALL